MSGRPSNAAAGDPESASGVPGRFRLMRYFTIATLLPFALAGAVVVVMQRGEEDFFAQIERAERVFFAQAQAELARQTEGAAREGLLSLHEASHVNLTLVVSNLLWASNFGPLVARAQQFPVEPCRALPGDGTAATPGTRKACLADLGQRIRALPDFKAVDKAAHGAMRATSVFKIKVWDLRGVTVYSSQQDQIGDDGSTNRGWMTAAAGQPASELTHRDRFSAFEGVVENRDLISSYVPVRDPAGGAIVGVFELYSDVTPFLARTQDASRRFNSIAGANEAMVERASNAAEDKVRQSSNRFLLIVGGLLLLLYGVSLLIVRIGQRIIDRQALAQERAVQREMSWHREKMAALAAMAANVSHEVGNPLAVISGLAQQLQDVPAPPGMPGMSPARLILEQTTRIAQMTRRISDFASARDGRAEWVDVNAMLRAVCDFLVFDSRLRGIRIEFVPAAGLPAHELVPDHLNEVMMNLLLTCAQVSAPKTIFVETLARGATIVIQVDCRRLDDSATPLPHDDTRLEPIRRRVAEMGGSLTVADGRVEIVLPPAAAGTG